MTSYGPEWQDPDTDPIVYVDEPTPPPAPPHKQRDPWTLILGIMGGVLLGTGVTFAILGATGVFEEPTPPPPPTLPSAPTLTLPPPTIAPPPLVSSGPASAVAERAIPSIVAVEVSSFLGQGGGSGVVYGTEGYVITNHHVVDGATSVAVVFADGARYDAEVVGSDALTDLAVILVERPDLTPIDIGSSGTLAIGEPAVAVGEPTRSRKADLR